MVKPCSFFHSFLVICFIQLSHLLSASGFTVDLIHRDSPLSPMYNASKTHSDRLRDAVIRSYSRAAYLRKAASKSKKRLQVPVLPAEFVYIMKLSIGTPPSPVYGIIDTGSDLSWTQCSLCDDCYKQNYPLFDPNKSSTYKPVLCSSDTCTTLSLVSTSCVGNGNNCQYRASYADGSSSAGEIAMETFTFGNTSVPDLIFGCGHKDQGLYTSKETGVIGLGFGKGSFANQLNDAINGKFSYCFTNRDPKSKQSGKISFGDDAIVSGPGTVTTPIVKRPEDPDSYFLTLESIKLGSKTLPYRTTTTSGIYQVHEGNVIIDSGTTLSFFPDALIADLESELKNTIKSKPIPDPQGVFSLCYDKTVKLDGPAITLQFTGGAIEVPQNNAFTETEDGLLCLGILPDSGLRILGNRLQVNFLVGYDIVANKLSFKPTDCSKL